MLENYRIIGVTPAGRKKYMQILVPYLLDNRAILDEHHFWVNTEVPEDLAYLQEVSARYPDFFKLIVLEEPFEPGKQVQRIRHFWKHAMDPDCVYVRFDDDICWMAPDAVAKLVRFRLDNPEYFFVYPATINNGRTAYLHYVMGHVDRSFTDRWTIACMEDFRLLHHPPTAAESLHTHFINTLANGEMESLKFHRYEILNYERVAINCICFFGRDIEKFDGQVATEATNWEEEWWLTEIKAKELGRPSCIHGEAIVSHFSFHTQRKHMEENTNLLSVYKLLCARRHEKGYTYLP